MNDFYPEGLKTENKRSIITTAILAEAKVQQTVLEAPVIMCDAAHNLIVNLGCMRGVIPRQEGALGIDNGTTRDIALISRVGKSVSFVVTGFSEDKNGKPFALLSRKTAQKLCLDHILKNKTVGDIIDAKITHFESLVPFAISVVETLHYYLLMLFRCQEYLTQKTDSIWAKTLKPLLKTLPLMEKLPFPTRNFWELGKKTPVFFRQVKR